jgi:hypothetical protein
MERKEIPIHDIHFAAFTILHNLIPQLKKINGRITFLYPSSETFHKLLRDFFEIQERFSLIDYIDALKKAKSLMYAAKEVDHE